MTILVIGRSTSGTLRAIEARGDDYIVLRDRIGAINPDKKFKRRVLCDFSSKTAVLAAVDGISQEIDAVFATYENYILPAAWITDYLGLPGLPLDAAEACTDKELMRRAFSHAPEKISPDFAVVSSPESITAFATRHSFPLILKPANLAKSLLVTKNNSLDELLANYRKAIGLIDKIYAKYAPDRQPKLIIEEFLEGTIHSVDAFVDKDGKPDVLDSVVDYLTGYDIGYGDNFHYARLLPSRLSAQDQEALRNTAAMGCRMLNMKNSPAHIEIIMTKGGPRIVEIGARNGGYRARMHRLSNGIDLLQMSFDLRLGITPSSIITKHEATAVLELFPKKPGIFKGIVMQPEVEKLPSLNYFAVKQKLGDFVGSSSDGYKMCAIIMLHNSDAVQFEEDLHFINKHVTVITEA